MAAGGYVGVDRALTRLQEEIERDMILMGCTLINKLDRGKLHRG
ncbi:MAG: alpha-hydroxy-acid oxidizing protein [Gammaproteobacteria bacterium]|nr:alpha-hydroxy-acid oxidizing protein [Gammaproteobacteria bacterium]